MKKFLMFLSVAACLAVYADEPKQSAKADPQKCDGKDQQCDKDQQQMQDQQRRRYEIMVLLQAYRIIPADKAVIREQLKAEIVGRLKEDFEANKELRKGEIERIEKRLAELKVAAGESADDKVNQEFERLINAPINGIGPRGWIGTEHKPGKGPGPEANQCEQPNGQGNRGDFSGGAGNRFGQAGQQGNRPMLNRQAGPQQRPQLPPSPPPQPEQPQPEQPQPPAPDKAQ